MTSFSQVSDQETGFEVSLLADFNNEYQSCSDKNDTESLSASSSHDIGNGNEEIVNYDDSVDEEEAAEYLFSSQLFCQVLLQEEEEMNLVRYHRLVCTVNVLFALLPKQTSFTSVIPENPQQFHLNKSHSPGLD